MTVIAFPRRIPLPAGPWSEAELRRLVAFSTTDAARAAGAEDPRWETGATERGEPQFYLLGPAPAHDCVLCVSRLGAAYVLEDGHGRIVAESACLSALFADAARMAARPRRSLTLRIGLLCCAIRVAIGEKIEPIMDEAMDIAVRFAPHAVMA